MDEPTPDIPAAPTPRRDSDQEQALSTELVVDDPELSPRPWTTQPTRLALWLGLLILVALLIAVLVLALR